MKVLAAAAVFALVGSIPVAIGQDSPSEDKHLIIPSNENRGVRLSALNIVRQYPTVVFLKGNVEIKIPVCLPVGKKRAPVCDGFTIVRADEATFHQDTGQIEAHGNVAVTPLEHER